eukprot:jgi/Chrzof1/11643/Cz06g03130.t1
MQLHSRPQVKLPGNALPCNVTKSSPVLRSSPHHGRLHRARYQSETTTKAKELTPMEALDQKINSSQELKDKVKNTKIAVYSSKEYVKEFMEKPVRGTFPDTKFCDAVLHKETAVLAAGYDVACLFVNDTADEAAVRELAADGVKLIAMRCAGFDRVDLKACAQHGIKVVRVPTYSPTSVAEHALALLMGINRNIHMAHQRVMIGDYALSGLVGYQMAGKTIGIMGTGAIGVEAVRIFKGIGMNVLAYDIYQNPKVKAMGVPYMEIDEILPQADVVSIHVPLLESTRHFMDKTKIDKLKPGCMIINVSRGGLVDTDAVTEGLENGQIGGLGMDVYENEASLFFTDWTVVSRKERMQHWDRRFKNLLSYPQVLITPHSAFLTHEALESIANTTVFNIKQWVAGEPLTNEVKAQ